MNKQVVISFKTMLLAVLLVLGLYIVYRLGPVIGVILLAALIVVAIEPMVKRFTTIKIFGQHFSRGFSVIISYLILILVLALVITIGVPPVVVQLEKLFLSLASISAKINFGNYFNFSLADIIPQATKISSGVLSVTFSVVSQIAAIISLLVLSVYMSLDWENIKDQLLSFFPTETEENIRGTLKEIESSVGYWVKGELILMTSVGVASFIGLEILNIKYPLALGLVSGVLEVVPILGPILSGVLAAIIAFVDSPVKGLGVIALYIIIQQLENNLLVPKIMQKVSGFIPLVILLALLIGSEFFGIVGAIVAVPVTIILSVVLKRLLHTGSQ